jgi:pyrimidine-nucleoside phosphorylase
VKLLVKVGGRTLEDRAERARFAAAIASARNAGHRVAVVHGGGEQIRAMAARLGLAERKVRGLRVTDAATSEVVQAVLGGLVGRDLAVGLGRAGVRAVSLTGADGGAFSARPLAPVEGVDLGYVGEVDAVAPELWHALLDAGVVPLIAPIAPAALREERAGADEGARYFNINADMAAAPIAAALGVRVAAMGGRGLAHTGGTADKLEAIPGFEADLSLERFVRQVHDAGIAVAAQSERLAGGDRRLAELRDATGTVPAPGLVAASTMARKLAGGAGAVHLEVAFGSGAFIGSEEEARATAELMARIAEPWGRRIGWSLCDMEQPLGRCVGNALEVGEAAEVLRGAGSQGLRAAGVRAAGGLAEAAGVVDEGTGPERARAALADGSALAAAERWVEAQGGDPAVWTDPGVLPDAPIRIDLPAPRAGVVRSIGARGVGEVARWLGAGRLHPAQSIDPVVGVELLVRAGDAVEDGQPMAVIHARDTWAGEQARDMAAPWFAVGEESEGA